MLDQLPLDVVAQLPLGAADLCRAACVCRGLRDAIARLRCARGQTVHERHLHLLGAPRYEPMTALRVVGPSAASAGLPPAPVPRAMPRLRELRLERCRMHAPGYWAAAVARAPALQTLVVAPEFGCTSYRWLLESLTDLMARAPGWTSLTRLELRGTGPVLWRTDGVDWLQPRAHPTWQACAAMHALPPARLPSLRQLGVVGRQACFGVDAPLEVAAVEDPDDPAASMVARLGPLARPTLHNLSWSLPARGVAGLCALPEFGALATVSLVVRDVDAPATLDAALAGLALLPPGVTWLRLALDVARLDPCAAAVRLDAAPLSHLARLHTLSVRLTTPVRGSGDLVSGLLGAPATVRLAVLRADEGAARAQWAQLAAMLADDDFDDPDEVEALEDEIAAVERAVRVPADALHAALRAFPLARLEVHGFDVDADAGHPRLVVTAPPPHVVCV